MKSFEKGLMQKKGPILGFFDAFPELWCLLIILGVLGLSITCEQEHYAEAKTL